MKQHYRERDIEAYLRKQCMANAILCQKYTSPANNGVPDRFLAGYHHATHQPISIFVECKAPGEKPRKLQLSQFRTMRDTYGLIIEVVDTFERADEILRTHFGVN